MPTVAVSGVPPPGGTTVNQFPPELVETPVVTVPVPGRGTLLVTMTCCVGGSAPFTVNVSPVEFADNVVGGGVTTGALITIMFE
jgi:hypothetical protein